MLSFIKKLHPNRQGNPPAAGAPWLDGDCGIYAENYFNEVLRIERKRTDRSGRPFILVLFDLGEFSAITGRESSAEVAATLGGFTRDTDIKGWYLNGKTIGLLLLENADGIDARFVAQKLIAALSGKFGESRSRLIKVSFHHYPDEKSGRFDTALYPDLRDPDKGPPRVKRIIDILLSAAGLVILSPLFAAISILVLMTSAGPVFFRQERIGRLGKRFTFLKFRSMYVNGNHNIHQEFIREFIRPEGPAATKAELKAAKTRSVYKIERDPRVTPVGQFLRKSSLDELPQLINVLKGDMSLIGPRPPLPYECEIYEPWHKTRVEAVPGITGLWQVKGRSRTSFDEMVRLDLRYMREWSLWLDLKILVKTPWAVISCRGAY